MAGAILSGMRAALPLIPRWAALAAPAGGHWAWNASHGEDYGVRDAAVDIGAGLGLGAIGGIGGFIGRGALTSGIGGKAASFLLPDSMIAGAAKALPYAGGIGGYALPSILGGYDDTHGGGGKKKKSPADEASDQAAGFRAMSMGGLDSASAMDKALKSLMGTSTATLTDKIVNRYLSAAASPYDTAIASMRDDVKDSMRRNNDIAFNLGRDLAVGGRTSRAEARNRKRANARQMEVEIGAQAAQDAAVAQELGVDPAVLAGTSDVQRASSRADRAKFDETAMLMGESNASFADEAAKWAKADAAEQNRQLQRQGNKAIASLNADKAAKIASTQFALQQMQISQMKEQAQNQFDIAKLMAQRERDGSDQKMKILQLLMQYGSRTTDAPLWMNDKGEYSQQYSPGLKPAMDNSGRVITTPAVPQNDITQYLMEMLGLGGS